MQTSKAEVLRLYREIIRTTKQFALWQHPQGEPWSAVLQRSARREFDACKHERSPEVVARMIYVGYDCLNATKEKFQKALVNPNSSRPAR